MPSARLSTHAQLKKCDTFPRSVTLFRRGSPAALDSPTASNWRKSSNSPTHTAIRDSKTPAGVALTFPTGAFAPFIAALKPTHSTHSTVTDFARFRG
ncbi:DUF397 domain-containing protein [Streptomyces sp. NPDC051642]|uniref:DUF397 domain-containing protein n=1 Tax=unclassified Streptomyces TaxID=2593676 RepID=UPI003433CFA9